MSKCIICFELIDNGMEMWCICKGIDNKCEIEICNKCSHKYTNPGAFICSEQAMIKYMTYYHCDENWINDDWFKYSNRNIFIEDQQKRINNVTHKNKKNATKCLNKYFYSDLVDIIVSFVIYKWQN